MAARVENLKPMRPGEPGRNPSGRNQYSYRSQANELLEELLLETRQDEPGTRLRTVLDRGLVREAEKGRPWAMGMLLDRVLPKVERLEHQRCTEADPTELAERLAEIARKHRASLAAQGLLLARKRGDEPDSAA